MKRALRLVPVFGLLLLSGLPGTATAFTISLPADSAVNVDSASRLLFRVTNSNEHEGLSRLELRVPAGYRITGGSAPLGWTVEVSPGDTAGIAFRTSDETKCTGAIAPKQSLVFGVELTARPSRSVSRDGLVSAQAEQSCRGVALDPPPSLPSWERLGLAAALTAGPATIGVGGAVTATMTVTNLSTVELTNISALLHSAGTGGASLSQGPAPSNLTLTPGASGSVTWTYRATSPGIVSFSGQAVAQDLASPPTRTGSLLVGDLEVSLSLAPEQVVSGQEVQVQMTVKNRGPGRVVNVTPSALAFEGTAVVGGPAGPTPTSQPALEPEESATFVWTATISGRPGDTFAFSGWASAEYGAIVSTSAISNSGALGRQDVAEQPGNESAGDAGFLTGGGGGLGDSGTAAAAGGSAAVAPGATLQFIGINQDGKQTGGVEFFANLLRDLRILVAWQNLSGAHSQRLELFAPDGSLYQRFSTQFAGNPVETRLPVGGTWITQSSLFGAWRVDVFLDNGASLVTSGVFLLTP